MKTTILLMSLLFFMLIPIAHAQSLVFDRNVTFTTSPSYTTTTANDNMGVFRYSPTLRALAHLSYDYNVTLSVFNNNYNYLGDVLTGLRYNITGGRITHNWEYYPGYQYLFSSSTGGISRWTINNNFNYSYTLCTYGGVNSCPTAGAGANWQYGIYYNTTNNHYIIPNGSVATFDEYDSAGHYMQNVITLDTLPSSFTNWYFDNYGNILAIASADNKIIGYTHLSGVNYSNTFNLSMPGYYSNFFYDALTNQVYLSNDSYNQNSTFSIYNLTGNNINTVPSGYQIVNNTAFDNSACVYDGVAQTTSYCANATIYAVGYQHNDPLGLFYAQAYCNEPLVTCQDVCQEVAFTAPPSLVDAGYSQYNSAYCTPVTLNGSNECLVKGSSKCLAGRAYETCNDYNGDGFLEWSPSSCAYTEYCYEANGVASCQTTNITSWAYVDYQYTFIPYMDESKIYDATRVNPLTFITSWYKSQTNIGNILLNAFYANVPVIGQTILAYQAVSSTQGAIVDTMNNATVSVFKFNYDDNSPVLIPTYTSLNCDYKEAFIEQDPTMYDVNSTKNYTLGVQSNSERYYFDLNTTNLSEVNVTISNGISDIMKFTIEVDHIGGSVSIYDHGNVTGSIVYPGDIDDRQGIHFTIDYNKPTGTYSLLGKLNPDNARSDNAIITAGLSVSVSNPQLIIFQAANNNDFQIANFIRAKRTEVTAYSSSVKNDPDAYQCVYSDNVAHLVRLFSQGSQQPVYQRASYSEKDIYVMPSRSAAQDTGGNIGNTPISPPKSMTDLSCILSDLAKCNSGVQILFALVIISTILIACVAGGAFTGFFKFFVGAGLILSVMLLIAFTVFGWFPLWVLLIIILLAIGVLVLMIRGLTQTQGGG